MFVYKIFGRQPGFVEGLSFNSCVKNLQNQPELWLDECPYLHPLSSALPEKLRVELVSSSSDDAFAPTLPLALAA